MMILNDTEIKSNITIQEAVEVMRTAFFYHSKSYLS
jgi:hypothetical protein